MALSQNGLSQNGLHSSNLEQLVIFIRRSDGFPCRYGQLSPCPRMFLPTFKLFLLPFPSEVAAILPSVATCLAKPTKLTKLKRPVSDSREQCSQSRTSFHVQNSVFEGCKWAFGAQPSRWLTLRRRGRERSPSILSEAASRQLGSQIRFSGRCLKPCSSSDSAREGESQASYRDGAMHTQFHIRSHPGGLATRPVRQLRSSVRMSV